MSTNSGGAGSSAGTSGAGSTGSAGQAANLGPSGSPANQTDASAAVNRSAESAQVEREQQTTAQRMGAEAMNPRSAGTTPQSRAEAKGTADSAQTEREQLTVAQRMGAEPVNPSSAGTAPQSRAEAATASVNGTVQSAQAEREQQTAAQRMGAEAVNPRNGGTAPQSRTEAAQSNVVEPSTERERASLDPEAEAKRSAWLKQAEAKPAETTPQASKPAAGNTVDPDETFRPSGDVQRVLPKEVADKYLQVGDKFYHPKNTQVAAFEDKGTRLETRSDGEQVADTLVAIAKARGWDEIKVSGSETFRREVWLEATANGMQVKGYTPSEQDRAELAKRERETKADNAIQEAGKGAATKAVADITRSDSGSSPQVERQSLTEPVAQPKVATPDKAERTDAPSPAQQAQTTSTLVAHGEAPYRHDPKNPSSYYVTVRDDAGKESTRWGVDLGRAIKESGAQPGERITLAQEGAKAVSVPVRTADANGEVVAIDTKEAQRMTWRVERAEAFATKPPQEAVREHPELAGSYAARAAAERQAAADNLTPEQRAVVSKRVQQNIVNALERGDSPPEIRVRSFSQEADKTVQALPEKELAR